jgi:sulfonate transport system ATP-binding protein
MVNPTVKAGNISIQEISKTFSQLDGTLTQALNELVLDIQPGEFVTLIGPSGCGKSTLLRLIAGLIAPDKGRITLDEVPIKAAGPDRGFVFQQHTLFPWLTIQQNIAFGLKTQKKYAHQKDEVAAWLKLIGLEGFGNSYPHQLSGGMCQRAALARALITKPKILLLDEPLGALDAFTRMLMQDELLKMWQEHQTTMVMVTHDVDEAIYLSDKVVIISARPGKIDKIVTINLPRPRARNAESFIDYRKKILDRLHFGGTQKEPEYYL